MGLRLVEAWEARADVEPPRRDPATGRRTVTIEGRPGERRAPRRAASTRVASRPDRIAMWAVMLGLLLAAMSAATARADQPADATAAAPAVQDAR